ncbi:protein timeless homolog [Hyposmocoma kahamanoa]|uniref:protein timeless homolog n=1 Tax=Hyposmocoma kahamanoa TaxID=1477025 RepID=UPI000E6D7ECE|nr:protein timeless homolog [Hyposmocoma kahamanoa]
MTSMLSAELSATCNALGTFDKKTGKYLIDEYTLNTVKDLIRYLRRDGEEHEIRRHLGQTKVLQTDLLPMLIDHWENAELFDVTLRLLVNLTNPALLLYHEEVPVERTARHNYLQILSHLQNYKDETFTKVDTWNVFAKKLAKILEIDWSERDEDTGLVIERILILIRNVLHVPADLDRERRPENDASVHDQVLWGLNQSGILDILLYMSSENEKQYFMHILEIVSHLLREQNPSALADAALRRSGQEKLRDDQELLALRASESKQRLDKIRQYSAARHSRFGGTYVVQNMKSISENELISFKPLTEFSKLDFSGSKKSKLVRPKNRRPVESGILERRSAFAVRLFLKEFCIEFLNSSYNPLMRHAKDVLVRARAQQNDESYYLWALKFFMEFNRAHDFRIGLVSETVSVPTFHFVQQQMEKYCDTLKVEKKRPWPWVRRLHLALRAYKELLQTLWAMGADAAADVRDSARVFQSNIFYVPEYREFILALFLDYDETKMPRSYLEDLLETVHLFLKMLERFCKKTGLVVQKRVRKKAKSKSMRPSAVAAERPRGAPAAPWEAARAQLAAVLRRGAPARAPCDAAAPLPRQREDCMKNIQKSMREFKFEDAVGMFRAARELWPEEGIFGADGIAEDEELEMLETVYNADLGGDDAVEPASEGADERRDESGGDSEEGTAGRSAVARAASGLEPRNRSVSGEGEGAEETRAEADFDFLEFVHRWCQPRAVGACVAALRHLERRPRPAHCALRLLHRVARQRRRRGPGGRVQRPAEEAAPRRECDYPRASGRDSELTRAPVSPRPADVVDWILDNLVQRGRTRRGVLAKLRQLGLVFRAPTKRSGADGARRRRARRSAAATNAEEEATPPADLRGEAAQRPQRPPRPGAGELARLLAGAVARGFSEALSWLAESLEEVALDQEAEGYDPAAEGTPLVPISREAVEATASPLFAEVLRGIGVVPPADEQEAYWRIPSSLHFEAIRSRREMILKAVSGQPVADESGADADQLASADRKRSRGAEPGAPAGRTDDAGDSDDDDVLPTRRSKKRRVVIDDDSD